ncbi:MAG: SGNH/GDSL hydrolase family protein [bacterium]
MKNINKLLGLIFISALLVFTSCEDRSDLTEPALPNTGSADFTRFVCLGNSLTQGEQSNSVYESAQEYSFGNLIAKQVGTTYAQALFSDPGSGGRIEVETISPFKTKINTATGTPINLTYAAPYNNLGVKGAFLYDLLFTTTASNCYTSQAPMNTPNAMFDAVLRGLGTQVHQAVLQHPTFATVWIGNNDILAYATRGGLFPVTSMDNFQLWYNAILDSLSAIGTKVVVANIPDVTSIAYLNTVGPTLLASGINVVWGTNALNEVVPIDLTKNLLTLTAQAELAVGKGLSQTNPLPNGVILDESEILIAKQVVAGYNQIISGVAAAHGFAVVDINALLTQASTTGITYDGIKFTAQYVQGGLFSLDGVHPTSQGYAIIANEFIKVINTKYSASIPQINIATIPGSLVLGKISFGKNGLPIFPIGTFDHILF